MFWLNFFMELIQDYGCKTNTSKGEINDTFWDKFEKEQQDRKIGIQHNHQ